jgi:hypothetical protein
VKLTKIEKVGSYSDTQQLIYLIFDDGADAAYMIWTYDNLVPYLNEEVIATFRQDMYNGRIEKFVNTLAKVNVVHTLEKENNFKLYVDAIDSNSTVMFRDITEGATVFGAIVYVVDVKLGSSINAKWADLTVMDKARKLSRLRMFSVENTVNALRGRYIQCDIHKNSYGLSTELCVTCDSTFLHNPEVELSERFLLNMFAGVPDILTLLVDSNFIAIAKKFIDMEPGYVLVRLATELDIAAELTNLLKDVDVDLVKRCLLIDKLSVIRSTLPYHKDIVSFVAASRYTYDKRAEVFLTLYSDDEKFIPERMMIAQVKSMADTVLRVKKGLVE